MTHDAAVGPLQHSAKTIAIRRRRCKLGPDVKSPQSHKEGFDMRLIARLAWGTCLAAALAAVAAQAVPPSPPDEGARPAAAGAAATRPATSSVTGTVTAASEIPLSEMVVYL